MKLGKMAVTASLLVSSVLGIGCNRNRQEAVILANEADAEGKINVDGAINKLDQATRLDATNHRIFFKLALAHKKKEDWEKVASTLARATQLAPKFANYWAERGFALEKQAQKKTVQYDEAKEPYQKCIENDPNYADCYENLGRIFLWTDDEQKALENYTKAIEHDPTNISYYAALADLYINLGYMKEAEQVLKEAKSFAKPGDKALYDIHVLLSQVLQDRSAMPEMVTELEAAKGIAGSDGSEAIEILFHLGSTYAILNPPRKTEAIQMLKGFSSRACKGTKAQAYKTQCETAQTLVTQLGGSMQ